MVPQKFQKQPPKMFYKKAFLEVSQNSQENSYARDSFLKAHSQV